MPKTVTETPETIEESGKTLFLSDIENVSFDLHRSHWSNGRALVRTVGGQILAFFDKKSIKALRAFVASPAVDTKLEPEPEPETAAEPEPAKTKAPKA